MHWTTGSVFWRATEHYPEESDLEQNTLKSNLEIKIAAQKAHMNRSIFFPNFHCEGEKKAAHVLSFVPVAQCPPASTETGMHAKVSEWNRGSFYAVEDYGLSLPFHTFSKTNHITTPPNTYKSTVSMLCWDPSILVDRSYERSYSFI